MKQNPSVPTVGVRQCTTAYEKRPVRQYHAELVFHFEILLAIEDAA